MRERCTGVLAQVLNSATSVFYDRTDTAIQRPCFICIIVVRLRSAAFLSVMRLLRVRDQIFLQPASQFLFSRVRQHRNPAGSAPESRITVFFKIRHHVELIVRGGQEHRLTAFEEHVIFRLMVPTSTGSNLKFISSPSSPAVLMSRSVPPMNPTASTFTEYSSTAAVTRAASCRLNYRIFAA